jgi:hypothetical protein
VLVADGQPVTVWSSFRGELIAGGCSAATCRSYAHDVRRWLRFLAALGISWQQAGRVEVCDFVWWLRGPTPRRWPTIRPAPVRDPDRVTTDDGV